MKAKVTVSYDPAWVDASTGVVKTGLGAVARGARFLGSKVTAHFPLKVSVSKVPTEEQTALDLSPIAE